MRRIILMFITNFYRLPYLFTKLIMIHNREKHDRFEQYAFLHKSIPGANKGGRVEIIATGLENLPKDNGYIIFPNHQGMYDILSFIQVLDYPFSVVSKKETKGVFLLNTILNMLGAEFIDREDIRQSLTVINNVTRRVREGENFIIFPEGTRSKLGNEMLPFKGGTFKSAMNAHCPIIPAALIDSFKPFDEPSIKKTSVKLHIMKPLYYEDYKDMKSTEIALLVHDTIRDYIHSHT